MLHDIKLFVSESSTSLHNFARKAGTPIPFSRGCIVSSLIKQSMVKIIYFELKVLKMIHKKLSEAKGTTYDEGTVNVRYNKTAVVKINWTSLLTSKMLRTKISLKNFFIFNSTFCTREGEVRETLPGKDFVAFKNNFDFRMRRKFCFSIQKSTRTKSLKMLASLKRLSSLQVHFRLIRQQRQMC